jgi:hypothetical protein
MACRISVENGILCIDVTDMWDHAQAVAAQAETGMLAREHGIKRLMIDLSRATILQNTVEVFNFTPTHARAFPAGMRHAVVALEEFARCADAQFGETVAANSCVSMRIFSSRRDARGWLESEE